MEPSLTSGQLFFYLPGRLRARDLRRGQVVLLRHHGSTWVKRVFAVGGQSVWRAANPRDPAYCVAVLAGDEPVDRFRARFPGLVFRRERIPEGRVFVLGDSSTSIDSRQLGPVPEQWLVGAALVPAVDQAGISAHVFSWSKLPPLPPRSRHIRLALRTGS